MEIDRDRIALIKAAHLKFLIEGKRKIVKPKKPIKEKVLIKKEVRPYVIKSPRPKMSPEERRIRRYNNHKNRVNKFKELGMCIKCGKPPILVIYMCGEEVLAEKKTVFCQKHSKNMKIKGEECDSVSTSHDIKPNLPDLLPANNSSEVGEKNTAPSPQEKPQSNAGDSVLLPTRG